jgi:hypothetical protein
MKRRVLPVNNPQKRLIHLDQVKCLKGIIFITAGDKQ